MKTREALNENGKICISNNSPDYAFENSDGVLVWNNNGENEPVRLCLINDVDWQPFREEEIRPENAGELWESPSGAKFITYKELEILYFATKDTSHKCFDNEERLGCFSEWTRLFPPVEDDSVEFRKVTFDRIIGENGAKYMSIISTSCDSPSLEILKGKCAKIMLEIPKES